MRRLRPPATLVLLLALLLPVEPARGAEDLGDLVRAYEALLGQRTDAAYEAQRDVLARIADLRTEAAREQLGTLLARHARADRRRAADLLAALVRHGTPRDVDAAILWVERESRDPLQLELLHRVLAEVRAPATRAWLRTDALRKATPRVKAQIVRALGEAGDRDAVLPLLALLRDDNLLVRVETLEALGRLHAVRALPLVQVFLRESDANLRAAAARTLGAIGDARALPALRRALEDEAPLVAESAAEALGGLGETAVVPDLIAGLERVRERDLRLADAFVRALQALSGKAIQDDPELWRAWWAAVKDGPLVRGEGGPEPGPDTTPRYYSLPVRSSRLVFVLDVSRSMGWNERLVAAKEEILKVLEQLPATTRFNVVTYSDDAAAWQDALTTASRGHVRRAVDFVRALRPDNGTNTHAALARAFQDPEVDTVFFLSDGHPSVGVVTDPDLILLAVREWNRLRRVKVHAIALLRGEPPAAFAGREDPERAERFMRSLAAENDGIFKRVQ
jgi:HEAT repeat protein